MHGNNAQKTEIGLHFKVKFFNNIFFKMNQKQNLIYKMWGILTNFLTTAI